MGDHDDIEDDRPADFEPDPDEADSFGDDACCAFGEDCQRDGEPHAPDACVYLAPQQHELGAGDA